MQLLRWMDCGPVIACCVSEFEASLPYYQQKNEFEYKHHVQTSSRQQRFPTHVLSLVQVITNMENPFLEKSEDLLLLDTRNIANMNVVNTVNLIETLGNEQFSNFVNNRLKSSTKSLFLV